MRLAISNIAWDVSGDEAIADLLIGHKIDAIDIAPGKYFPDPTNVTAEQIGKVRTWWATRGIEITGMQALLFGTTGLNVFGTVEVQTALLKHLDGICRIGGILGATRIVFGSPKNRDRSGLDDAQALETATSFFRKVGASAERHGVIVCLEPNPPCYGANFMCTSDETAEVVRAVGHSAICMQLDTGALTINGENPYSVLVAHAELIGHVHASEPDLVPLGDGITQHVAMAQAIAQYIPNHLITIEMVATKTEPQIVSIERALRVASTAYSNPRKTMS